MSCYSPKFSLHLSASCHWLTLVHSLFLHFQCTTSTLRMEYAIRYKLTKKFYHFFSSRWWCRLSIVLNLNWKQHNDIARAGYSPCGHWERILSLSVAIVLAGAYLLGPMSVPSYNRNLSSTRSSPAIPPLPSPLCLWYPLCRACCKTRPS